MIGCIYVYFESLCDVILNILYRRSMYNYFALRGMFNFFYPKNSLIFLYTHSMYINLATATQDRLDLGLF